MPGYIPLSSAGAAPETEGAVEAYRMRVRALSKPDHDTSTCSCGVSRFRDSRVCGTSGSNGCPSGGLCSEWMPVRGRYTGFMMWEEVRR